MLTVSPLLELEIALLTSDCEQLAALIVAAWVSEYANRPAISDALMNQLIGFLMLAVPFMILVLLRYAGEQRSP